MSWLELNKTGITTHKIVNELPKYGKRTFHKLYSPTTYDREWRILREKGLQTKAVKIKGKNGSNYHKWDVE